MLKKTLLCLCLLLAIAMVGISCSSSVETKKVTFKAGSYSN